MNSIERNNFAAENILTAVGELGIITNDAFLDGEFRGGQCHVFKVKFKYDKDRSMAVRIPLYMGPCSPDALIAAFQGELGVLDFLEAKGFPWSPRCRGRSLTFDNAIKYPFIVLTWMDGSQLAWDEASPPLPLRDKILRQIAEIQLCLIECTLESSPTTATAFFERIMKNRHTRVVEGSLPNLTEQDCLDQQMLLPKVLGEDGNDKVLAMDHGDLKPENIIVDDDYNIKGIIDWAFAAQVPLPRATGLPRFLWSSSLLVTPSTTIHRDRQAYVACIASFSLSSPSSQQIVSYMQRWQTSRDVDLRTVYLESLFSKGMHYDLARAGWKVPCCGPAEHDRPFLSG